MGSMQLGLGSDIAVLCLDSDLGQSGRRSGGRLEWSMPTGLRHIVSEIEHETGRLVDVASPQDAGRYETLLWSITSPVEIEKMWMSGYRKPRGQTVIAGGMCALNPWATMGLVDVMVFGRAEGQIASILNGDSPNNVWRLRDDPHIDGHYTIRQARSLLPGERQVGCRYRCRFCQYAHIRAHLVAGRGYDSGAISAEDSWRDLHIEGGGRYTTAIDGLSERTRRRVHKPVSDEDIVSSITAWQGMDCQSAIVLKVYMIVGYPWETPETVLRDVYEFRQLLAAADSGSGGRVVLMLLFTPFSPEPMTPMQCDDIPEVDWGPVLERAGRALYWSEHLEAFILPQVASHATLTRRIAVNRCEAGTDLAASLRSARSSAVDVPRDWSGYHHLEVAL